MTAKLWFHLNRFKILKFQTWRWGKLKKSMSQLPLFSPSLSFSHSPSAAYSLQLFSPINLSIKTVKFQLELSFEKTDLSNQHLPHFWREHTSFYKTISSIKTILLKFETSAKVLKLLVTLFMIYDNKLECLILTSVPVFVANVGTLRYEYFQPDLISLG
jgi:hypothetical protein